VGTIVQDWFGERFSELHPMIQELHTDDHRLKGVCQLEYSNGFAGKLGRSFGKKMNMPTQSGETELIVDMHHTDESLLWSRQFGATKNVISTFIPVGRFPDGGWREKTDDIEINLGVEIKNGAWHWVQNSVRLRGAPVPSIFSPKVTAYKDVLDGKYCFRVEFALPKIGRLFKYSGLLEVV